MIPLRFPIFLPESRSMAVKTVVGWALRGADHVPAKALRLLYYPGRGALLTARPSDHVEVFEASRRELHAQRLVGRGLAREAADLLLEHQRQAESEEWFERALESRWSETQIRTKLGLTKATRASGFDVEDVLSSSELDPDGGLGTSVSHAPTGRRAFESARSLKDAAIRIRAILVSNTLAAMLEVGEIVGALRSHAKVSYRVLAEETGLGISHTALRNAEKVAAQYDLLPPWVRESLPYSHHVALLPVRGLAVKRDLACRAFHRSVPTSLRDFQALVGETARAHSEEPSALSAPKWLSSLRGLVDAQPAWADVLAAMAETPSDELTEGVELVGDALDRLSRVEEQLSEELARRKG